MSEISVTHGDGVAIVRLNAPERRNALTPQMARDLISACDAIDADTSIGAAVVYGEGGHFCAGAHRAVLEVAGQDPTHPDSFDDNNVVYASFMRVGRLAVPTVAAVQGSAVGAGMNLMMAADLRVVAEDARIMAGFLRIGIHPGGGHFALMGRGAGREATAAASLFSQTLDGPAAKAAGIAWECVPEAEVIERALALASGPAGDPELSRAAVASFRLVLGPPALSWEAALQTERAMQMWSLRRRMLGLSTETAR